MPVVARVADQRSPMEESPAGIEAFLFEGRGGKCADNGWRGCRRSVGLELSGHPGPWGGLSKTVPRGARVPGWSVSSPVLLRWEERGWGEVVFERHADEPNCGGARGRLLVVARRLETSGSGLREGRRESSGDVPRPRLGGVCMRLRLGDLLPS